jgi:hypothetical protein
MVILDFKAVIDDLTASLGISKDVLATALNTQPRSIDRWCRGENIPQTEQRKRLDALMRLKNHLYGTFNDGPSVHLWMQTNSRYLGGLKPVEVVRAGRIDRIEAALAALDYGAFV